MAIIASKILTTVENEKRSWLAVEFEVDAEHEDMASWLMIHLGANGCQLVAKNAEQSTLQASFERDKLTLEDLPQINAQLDEYGLGKCVASLRVKVIEEEDWLAEWKRGFKPLHLGEKFLVCPPWLKHELTENDLASRKIIFIEPGLAFGTGFHATTQFCLKALESQSKCQNVLDVGTGSGILAIAVALMTDTAKITAVEIDPVACKVANENFAINGVDRRVEMIEGTSEKVAGRKFDVILSNLTCEDNVALLPEYMTLLESQGKIIMSGILKEKLPRLEKSIKENNCTIAHSEIGDMWAGLVVEAANG